jgi:hypothetical protein
LLRDAGINRRQEKQDEVPLHERLQAEVHENFLKHRRTYAPLPPVDEEEN